MKTLGSRPMASVSGQYAMSDQTNLCLKSYRCELGVLLFGTQCDTLRMVLNHLQIEWLRCVEAGAIISSKCLNTSYLKEELRCVVKRCCFCGRFVTDVGFLQKNCTDVSFYLRFYRINYCSFL